MSGLAPLQSRPAWRTVSPRPAAASRPEALHALARSLVTDGFLSAQEWEASLAPLASAPDTSSEGLLALWQGLASRDAVVAPQAAKALGDRFSPWVPRPERAAAPPFSAPHIDAPNAWFEALRNQFGVAFALKIAVVDTGFDPSHPELRDNFAQVPAPTPAATQADVDHGNHVLGLATGGLPVQAFAISVRGTHPDAVTFELERAISAGARVVNVSLYEDPGGPLSAVLASAARRHPQVLFVIAAGNAGHLLGASQPVDQFYQPVLRASNMALVAAADLDGRRAAFSNFGRPYVALAAPGASQLSAIGGGLYAFRNGTSVAAPLATRAASMCWMLDPQLGAAEVLRLLQRTSLPRPEWRDLSNSGGLLWPELAACVAAVSGAVRRGTGLFEAVQRVRPFLPQGARPEQVEGLALELLGVRRPTTLPR